METERTKEILKKVRQVEVHTNRLVDDTLSGSYTSIFKGWGMNFDEVREYVAGDDIRAIDWKVTARTGSPHIKKFTEERELTLMLIIDISRSGEFGSAISSKRELMAEIGSILAFSAIKNNDKVGLILFSDIIELFIPPKKGRSHILRLIREILFFTPQSEKTDLLLPLDFINRVIKRKCIAFYISDFATSTNKTHQQKNLLAKLKLTNKRHDLVSIVIKDPCELELPDIGLITLEDAETGEQVEINSSSPAVRQEYKTLADREYTKLKSAFKQGGVDYLQLKTGEPYLPALISFFSSRKGKRRV